jgi:hypothetical protein
VEELTSTAITFKTKQSTILAKQKDETLAAFYTPPDVAQILTDWALTHPEDTVLDPSYGGCSFLKAAQTMLIKRGNSNPEKQIYGIDIDPDAQNYSGELISAGARQQQFISEDFFKVDINCFGGRLFRAVVGNPPYLRYHSIPKGKHKFAGHYWKHKLAGAAKLCFQSQFVISGYAQVFSRYALIFSNYAQADNFIDVNRSVLFVPDISRRGLRRRRCNLRPIRRKSLDRYLR